MMMLIKIHMYNHNACMRRNCNSAPHLQTFTHPPPLNLHQTHQGGEGGGGHKWAAQFKRLLQLSSCVIIIVIITTTTTTTITLTLFTTATSLSFAAAAAAARDARMWRASVAGVGYFKQKRGMDVRGEV